MKAMSFIQRPDSRSTRYRSPFAGNSTICTQTVRMLTRSAGLCTGIVRHNGTAAI